MNTHESNPTESTEPPRPIVRRRDSAGRILTLAKSLGQNSQITQTVQSQRADVENVPKCPTNSKMQTDPLPAALPGSRVAEAGFADAERHEPVLVNTVKLSPQQMLAIELLSIGRSLTGTAQTLGVNRRTLRRWREDNPAFAAELGRRQREMYESAASKIRTTLLKSLAVIDQALHDNANGTKTALKFVAHVDMKKLLVPAEPRDEAAIADEVVRKYRERMGVDPNTPISEDERSLIFEAAGKHG